MMLTYILGIIKSIFTRLMAHCCLMFGSVTNYFAPVMRYQKLKASSITILKESYSRLMLPLDPKKMALMCAIADQSNIPREKVIGFRLAHGRWFICLKEIGWLRTSDLLQMQIQLYTPTEGTK